MGDQAQEFLEKMEACALVISDTCEKTKRLHRSTIWVVGIASAIVVTFGTVLMVQGFTTTRQSTMSAEGLKRISETQTITLGNEIRSRELSDEDLKREIQILDQKLDSYFRWLIDNGDFKKRGGLPLTISK